MADEYIQTSCTCAALAASGVQPPCSFCENILENFHPKITIDKAIKYTTEAAKSEKRECFLYRYQATGEYFASFEYYPDWIFRAYPGGKRILRTITKAENQIGILFNG
jgi:hypothetical protein